MLSFFQKVRLIFDRDARQLYLVSEFAHINKDLLIIVADPKTDRMFVTYKDKQVNGRIKSLKGKKTHVVKEVLSNSRFKESIDGFIASMAETLDLPLWKGNQFYQFLDGAVFKIGRALQGKADKPPASSGKEGMVPSPFMAGEPESKE